MTSITKVSSEKKMKKAIFKKGTGKLAKSGFLKKISKKRKGGRAKTSKFGKVPKRKRLKALRKMISQKRYLKLSDFDDLVNISELQGLEYD